MCNIKTESTYYLVGSHAKLFHMAGRQLSFEDIRETMFFESARAVKEIQPKVFLPKMLRGPVKP